jgi:hypothetical protein
MIPEQSKLNIGCGFKKFDDYWNIDINSKCNPNQILDIESTPWPYEDSFFEKIISQNSLQCVGQDPKVFTEIIKEMYRVSQPEAEWVITVPHHRSESFWSDYTYVRPITPNTFSLFDQKLNQMSMNNNLVINPLGLLHNVDLEIIDTNFDILDIWRKQISDGMLGQQQLNIKLNTLSNVANTFTVFIKVHKPGRFEYLI